MTTETKQMKWAQLRVKEAPESVVVMATENMLVGVEEGDYKPFASHFGMNLNKRLRRMGYHKVKFEGPKEAAGGLWGVGEGPWVLRVLLQGGRWAYHSAAIERLVHQQMEASYAELALVRAQRDALAAQGTGKQQNEPPRIIAPG